MSLDQITVRLARSDDADAVAGVHDRAWRGAYRGIIPGVALERMIERRGPQWWARLIRRQRSVLVLEFHGKIAGYATVGPNRSKTLRVSGEIYELYVDPVFQGIGFGRMLFEAARDRLRIARRSDLVVWVLEANVSAVAFYKSMGGEPVAHGVEHFATHNAFAVGVSDDAPHDEACRKLAYVWGDG